MWKEKWVFSDDEPNYTLTRVSQNSKCVRVCRVHTSDGAR